MAKAPLKEADRHIKNRLKKRVNWLNLTLSNLNNRGHQAGANFLPLVDPIDIFTVAYAF